MTPAIPARRSDAKNEGPHLAKVDAQRHDHLAVEGPGFDDGAIRGFSRKSHVRKIRTTPSPARKRRYFEYGIRPKKLIGPVANAGAGMVYPMDPQMMRMISSRAIAAPNVKRRPKSGSLP
jgi:hypothetical protein